MSEESNMLKLTLPQKAGTNRMAECRSVFFNILTLIEDLPFSLRALITYLGITKEEYNKWERDESDSYMQMLPKIAAFYEVPIEYLTANYI